MYAIDTKRKADVLKAMTDFLTDFASMGHVPRRILSDKGSDMKAAYTVIERYRQAQDGDKPMVLHTATGTPVLLVEALNAQVQRRMQVFRTSGLVDEASQIVHEIAYQINRQPRPDRGNLTPIQLLSLDRAGRAQINKMYRERTVDKVELPGLPDLNVNDTVRLLMMTRKEQEENKVKGFAPKWSEELYTVLRKTALRKNEFNFRYDVGLPDTFYRHELLKYTGVASTTRYQTSTFDTERLFTADTTLRTTRNGLTATHNTRSKHPSKAHQCGQHCLLYVGACYRSLEKIHPPPRP